MMTNPLNLLFTDPLSLALFIASLCYVSRSRPACDCIAGVVGRIYTAQIRIYYPSATFTSSSHSRAYLELVHGACLYCMFLHSRRIVSTARPACSHLQTPANLIDE
jgi:hypothetical protein